MRLPAEVSSGAGCSRATHLCLEFWRGAVFLGTYKLRLAQIRKALAGQVQDLNNYAFACACVIQDCLSENRSWL